MKILLTVILIFGISFANQVQSPIATESLLKLRNLQYEQAKRILRMQDLKSEFDKLNGEQQTIKIEIDSWVKEQAKIQNKDLTKFYFDFDKLNFVENPKADKPNE